MNILDHISESLKKYFWAQDPLNSLMQIRDLGWKKFGSGINIPDPQHCFNEDPESFLTRIGKENRNGIHIPDPQH
jgi:hypothetical protein